MTVIPEVRLFDALSFFVYLPTLFVGTSNTAFLYIPLNAYLPIVGGTERLKDTFLSLEALKNALAPIFVTDLGIVMLVSLTHFPNAEEPIVLSFDADLVVTLASLLQP